MIKSTQLKLISLGFGELLGKWGADGIRGKATEKATKSFQIWYNKTFSKSITEDGIPGPQTTKALDHARKEAGNKGTRNFSISEFYCKGSKGSARMRNGGMDNNLILKLEELRYNLGNNALVINSGYRSESHNKAVGGAKNSQHLYGKAADIVVRGVSASKVYAAADKIFNGVGKYTNFTHVDTRANKVRF